VALYREWAGSFVYQGIGTIFILNGFRSVYIKGNEALEHKVLSGKTWKNAFSS